MFIITSSGNLINEYVKFIEEKKIPLDEEMKNRFQKFQKSGFDDISFFYFHIGNMEVRITSTSLMIFEIDIDDIYRTLEKFPKELFYKTLINCGIFIECPIPVLKITDGKPFTTRGFVTKRHPIGRYKCCTVDDWNKILADPKEYRFVVLAAEMSGDRNYIIQRILVEQDPSIKKKLRKILHGKM